MMTDDYKEIGPSRRIIREGFNFETRKTIYCLDKGIFHYQFTNKKRAAKKKRFFNSQGWTSSKVYTV